MRFPRPLAGNVVLALVAPAVVLATLEGAARLLHLDTGFFLMPTPQNCLRRSRLLSMEFRPACAGSLHDTPLRTNADGLRGAQRGAGPADLRGAGVGFRCRRAP